MLIGMSRAFVQVSLSGFLCHLCLLKFTVFFQGKNDKIKISTTLNSLEGENEGKKSRGRRDWGKKNGKKKERIRWERKESQGEEREHFKTDFRRLHGLAVHSYHRLAGSNPISNICLQSLSFASYEMGSNTLQSTMKKDLGMISRMCRFHRPSSLPKNVKNLVKLFCWSLREQSTEMQK